MSVLSGCAIKLSQRGCEGKLWFAKIKYISNEVSLCSNDQSSSLYVYFPHENFSNRPTSCFQRGAAGEIDGKIYYNFEKGMCQNGREAGPITLVCELKSHKMICVDSDNSLKRNLVFELKGV